MFDIESLPMPNSNLPPPASDATALEELRPLIEFCRAGRLFDVQAWIAANKPINLAKHSPRQSSVQSPLEIALKLGFHSLAHVLLKHGARGTDGTFQRPLHLVLEARRFDLLEMLVQYGLAPTTIDMCEVFDSWDPKLMEYCIDLGADVETNSPLAYALSNRIQTALRVFKRYRSRFPSFQEQANLALRHHCIEGNQKWMSLMLWAGADPYSSGRTRWDEKDDPDSTGISALELAALYGRFEFFASKQVKLNAKHPIMPRVAQWACKGDGLKVLRKLLDLGLPINDLETGGSSIISYLLNSIDWGNRFGRFSAFGESNFFDSQVTQDRMQAIRLLVESGGKWIPKDKSEIDSIRRCLLKLKPEYTAEVVLVMSRHQACSKDQLEAMLKTPTIKKHVEKYQSQIGKLIANYI